MKKQQLSKERKAMKASGELPPFFTTNGLQMFKEKYLWDKSVKAQYKTIARTLAKHLKGTKWESEAESQFFTRMWKGFISPSTPVLGNTGNPNRGYPISCSGLYVPNSLRGFYGARTENVILTKGGHGASAYIGDIIPRGTPIDNGMKASGTMLIIDGFAKDMQDVIQGSGMRRGAVACYLSIEHGDFFEICNRLLSDDEGVNIGWNVHDSFIQRLDSGDKDAIERYQMALYTKMVTGKGYFFFVDKVNRAKPQAYINNNLDIKASNLCAAPETPILTDKGYFPIATLAGKDINVWNGKEFSSVKVEKTSDSSKLLTVKLDNGSVGDFTEYHKWYVVNENTSIIVEKRTNELRSGDRIMDFSFPVIPGNKKLNKAYILGYNTGKYHNTDGIVPGVEYDIDSRMKWLSGILDARGAMYTFNSSSLMKINCIDYRLLKDIQFFLNCLGVSSFLKESGYNREYKLVLNEYALWQLQQLGISTCRIKIAISKKPIDYSCIRIESVIDYKRTDSTYCFTEPKRGMGIFAGVITGNCAEIALHSSDEYSFECCISNNNLEMIGEEGFDLKENAYWITLMLECVTQEYIDLIQDKPFMQKVKEFAIKGRPLAQGVCGWHSLMMKKGIPVESLECQFLNDEIFRNIKEGATQASRELAEVFGEPEWCKGTGQRHTHLTALPPTKSTAVLMGGVSEGINLDPAIIYSKNTASGTIFVINKFILRIMKARGVYDDAHLQEVIDNQGSVQEVDWLSDDEKKVYKTAFEIDQMVPIRYTEQRQKYIDQSQSFNLFISGNETEEKISELHRYAFRSENIHSLYYIYSNTGVSGIKKVECDVCQ